MDPNSRLNFNFAGFNDRTYTPTNERTYPTTPSTFPQPIFSSQPGQQAQVAQDYMGAQLQSPGGYANDGNYFSNSPYQAHYGQQQQSQYHGQYQQQSIPSPQPSYQQQPRQGYVNNDATNGLVNQFSNQVNLGGAGRQPSPYGRHAAPGQRPHTAGNSGQQTLGNHLAPPMPGHGSTSRLDEEPPERDPERYSTNVAKRGKLVEAMIKSFFEQNVQRARERNIRYVT